MCCSQRWQFPRTHPAKLTFHASSEFAAIPHYSSLTMTMHKR